MKKIVFAILILFLTGVTFAHADIVVIIHGESDVTSIDKNTIKDIFLGRKTKWSDDTTITFIILKKGDVHKAFLKKALQKNPTQYINFWRRKLFLGKAAKLPKECASVEAVINYVSEHPGSIGYISSGGDISNQNIKQIFILK